MHDLHILHNKFMCAIHNDENVKSAVRKGWKASDAESNVFLCDAKNVGIALKIVASVKRSDIPERYFFFAHKKYVYMHIPCFPESSQAGAMVYDSTRKAHGRMWKSNVSGRTYGPEEKEEKRTTGSGRKPRIRIGVRRRLVSH